MTKQITMATEVHTGIVSKSTVGAEIDRFTEKLMEQVKHNVAEAVREVGYYSDRIASFERLLEEIAIDPEVQSKRGIDNGLMDFYTKEHENNKALLKVAQIKVAIAEAMLEAAKAQRTAKWNF